MHGGCLPVPALWEEISTTPTDKKLGHMKHAQRNGNRKSLLTKHAHMKFIVLIYAAGVSFFFLDALLT